MKEEGVYTSSYADKVTASLAHTLDAWESAQEKGITNALWS